MDDAEPLREALRPLAGAELFRGNLFRLTGLPVRASSSDVRRRRSEVQAAVRVGLPVPPPAVPAPPCGPEPTEREVSAAFDELRRDPVRRFVHEQLWLWGTDDPEDPDGLAAEHDAVIAEHCVLLAADWPDRHPAARSPETDERWSAVLAGWARLLARGVFWQRLERRALGYGDPRVGVRLVDGLRDQLPAHLLAINLAVAVHAATVDDDPAGAAGHVAMLRALPFRSGVVDGAVRDRARTARLEITRTTDRASRQAAADPATGADEATELLARTAAPLRVLTALLGPTDPTTAAAHDEVVTVLRATCVGYYNHTTVDRRARAAAIRSQLQAALELAVDRHLHERITDDLDILARNDAMTEHFVRNAFGLPLPPPKPRSPAPVESPETEQERRERERAERAARLAAREERLRLRREQEEPQREEERRRRLAEQRRREERWRKQDEERRRQQEQGRREQRRLDEQRRLEQERRPEPARSPGGSPPSAPRSPAPAEPRRTGSAPESPASDGVWNVVGCGVLLMILAVVVALVPVVLGWLSGPEWSGAGPIASMAAGCAVAAWIIATGWARWQARHRWRRPWPAGVVLGVTAALGLGVPAAGVALLFGAPWLPWGIGLLGAGLAGLALLWVAGAWVTGWPGHRQPYLPSHAFSALALLGGLPLLVIGFVAPIWSSGGIATRIEVAAGIALLVAGVGLARLHVPASSEIDHGPTAVARWCRAVGSLGWVCFGAGFVLLGFAPLRTVAIVLLGASPVLVVAGHVVLHRRIRR